MIGIAASIVGMVAAGLGVSIDRGFNRARYNAALTLNHFSQRLPQKTDIDALSEDLVGVVNKAMMPSNVHLWLRAAQGSDR
jgi:hypothetical protein